MRGRAPYGGAPHGQARTEEALTDGPRTEEPRTEEPRTDESRTDESRTVEARTEEALDRTGRRAERPAGSGGGRAVRQVAAADSLPPVHRRTASTIARYATPISRSTTPETTVLPGRAATSARQPARPTTCITFGNSRHWPGWVRAARFAIA